MRITKDDSRVLAAALKEFAHTNRPLYLNESAFNKALELVNKMELYGTDQRREGKKTNNQWPDVIIRWGNVPVIMTTKATKS